MTSSKVTSNSKKGNNAEKKSTSSKSSKNNDQNKNNSKKSGKGQDEKSTPSSQNNNNSKKSGKEQDKKTTPPSQNNNNSKKSLMGDDETTAAKDDLGTTVGIDYSKCDTTPSAPGEGSTVKSSMSKVEQTKPAPMKPAVKKKHRPFVKRIPLITVIALAILCGILLAIIIALATVLALRKEKEPEDYTFDPAVETTTPLLKPGPVNDPYYFLNRTAKLSLINTKRGTVRVADFFLDSMDRSVDPCNDFYSFACGKFAENHLLKSKENGGAAFVYSIKRLDLADEILQKYSGTSKAIENAKIYFTKCLKAAEEWKSSQHNSSEIESSLKKLMNELTSKSAIPFLKSGGKVNIAKSIEIALSYNATVLLVPMPTTKIKSVGPKYGYDPIFIPSSPMVADGRYESSSFVYQHVEKLLYEGVDNMKRLFHTTTNSPTKTVVNEILAFDEELFKEYSKITGQVDITEVDMSTFAAQVPQIPFQYFTTTFNWKGKVQVLKEHFIALNGLLSRYDKRVVANYIAVVTFIQWGENIKLVDCHRAMAKHFIPSLSYVFESRFPMSQYRQQVQTMLNDISTAMGEILSSADWIAPTTRQHALQKLNSSLNCIGFHDDYFDLKKVEATQAHIQINKSDSWPEMARKVAYASFKKKMEQTTQIFERDVYCKEMDFRDTNAAHLPLLNILAIYSGFTQFPLIGEGIPETILYGTLGSVIGHEFTHGYDTLGKNFGRYGEELDWWTDEDDNNFAHKAYCLVRWFDRYKDPATGRYENGTKTLSENIADLGGIKAALLAYRNFLNAHGKPKPMPGFEDFTEEQSLFVSSAQFFCRRFNPALITHLIDNDEHAVNRARVNNMATNTEDFARIFKCPAGSNHNPNHRRCSVW